MLSERTTSRHLACGGDGGSDDRFADGFTSAKSSGFGVRKGSGISGGFGVRNGGGISDRLRSGLSEPSSPPTGVRLSARRTDGGASTGFPGTPGPLARAGGGHGEGNGMARQKLRPSSSLASLEALRSPFEAAGGGGGVPKGTGGGRVRSGGVMAALLRPLLDALDDARGVRATGEAAMKVKGPFFCSETRSAMPLPAHKFDDSDKYPPASASSESYIRTPTLWIGAA